MIANRPIVSTPAIPSYCRRLRMRPRQAHTQSRAGHAYHARGPFPNNELAKMRPLIPPRRADANASRFPLTPPHRRGKWRALRLPHCRCAQIKSRRFVPAQHMPAFTARPRKTRWRPLASTPGHGDLKGKIATSLPNTHRLAEYIVDSGHLLESKLSAHPQRQTEKRVSHADNRGHTDGRPSANRQCERTVGSRVPRRCRCVSASPHRGHDLRRLCQQA